MSILKPAIVLAMMFTLVAPAGALAGKLTPNLLVNGDAEQGTPSATGDLVQSPGWLLMAGKFTTVPYGAPSFPSTNVAAKIGGGSNLFAGGPPSTNGTTVVEQFVNIDPYIAEIDAGGEPVTLSAFLGGNGTQNDYAQASVNFADANTTPLPGAFTIGPVTAATRGGVTNLLPVSATGTVPAGTRYVEVTITMADIDGTYSDAYADNISLTLGQTAVPAPTAGGVPISAPGPTGVALHVGLHGSGFRVRVQYTTPTQCSKRCAAHLQLRIRTGGRLYAAKLPGDGAIILGTRRGLSLAARTTVRFWVTVSRAALLKSPFSTTGGDRVAQTRLRVWVSTPTGEILTVRDGDIKVSIAQINSGTLAGLKGIL